MFTRRALLCALALLFIVAQVAVADRAALRIRQDPGPAPTDPASSAPPSSTADATTTVDASSSAPTDDPTSNESASPSRTTVGGNESSNATHSAASSGTPSATSSAAAKHRHEDNEPELPLTPKLTPALGVAGVFMILSGIALTFVGVRIKRLHIFMSVAYLGYVGLIVLLVYVCHPPVNDKFQGLYFFGAFATGCVLGGGSLFFQDITEGLGCPLGGFAFAMWLLVLKSGGTLDSQGGKIGLICGFTGAAWCLSFSQHTRYYGLIVCEAFAGSTITMMGIDCLSRAGLKEFWLYVWNLNDNVFPLGTTTYPITRGIKAEIAGTVILAVFGCMSQSKLWKVIKERREKKAAKRLKDEEDRDHLEADLGRRLEEQNNQERDQWEKTYGNKDAPVNSVSTFQNTEHDSTYHSQSENFKSSSVSLKAGSKKGEVFELGDMGTSIFGSDPGSSGAGRESKDKSRVRVSQEEIIVNSPTSPTGVQTYRAGPGSKSKGKSTNGKSYVKDESGQGYWAFVPNEKPPSPEVPPLPFTVPTGDEETKKSDDGDAKSIATAGESNRDPNEPVSGVGLSDRGIDVHERSRRDPEEEKFAFGIPHVDDDRSSVAATMDGLTDDDLSRSGTPLPQGEDSNGGDAAKSNRKTRSASSLKDDEAGKSELTLAVPDIEATRRHSTNLGGESEAWLGSLANLSFDDKSEEKPDWPLAGEPSRKEESTTGQEKQPQKARRLTKDALPEGQSNTTQLYRTNEWAKHSVVAETPMADDLAPPSEPGVEVKYGAEAAAPVDVDALQQSAFPPQPSTGRESSSSTTNPYRNTPSQSKQSLQQKGRGSVSRNDSSTSVQSQRQPKRAISNPATSAANLRSSSTNLLNQTVPESPVEDVQASSRNPYLSAADSNLTLMGQRQDRLQNRISTMSFATPDQLGVTTTPNPSNPNIAGASSSLGSPVASSENMSLDHVAPSDATKWNNEENETLAQRRKTLIQRANSRQQQDLKHSKSAGSKADHRPVNSSRPPQAPTGTHNREVFDSHQPQRGSAVSPAQRESLMAQWHADMAQDPTSAANLQRRSTTTGAASPAPGAGVAPVGSSTLIDSRRAQMQEEKRMAEVARAQSKKQGQAMENAINARMRSGDMLEAHNKKMRQMQRKANEGENKK